MSGVMTTGEPQVGFRFRMQWPDGRQEQMLVDAERALIGSAAHCEVRLPPETAMHEHVELVVHEGMVHFATKPMALGALPALDNVAAVEGRWPLGSVLRVGDVQMTVEVVNLGMAKARPPIWALFVAIPVIVLTAAGIALAQPKDTGLPPVPEAPAILPAKEAGVCPNVSPEQRPVLAAERMRVALAKRERSPFAPEEGLDAVGLFDVAASCYRNSGMPNEAQQADEAADSLRVRLDEDYRLRRVRLEHAYRTHQPTAAKRELSVLIPMTSKARGPYTDWLAALDRAATLEIEQRGRLAP
jgi:hypothetical protein